MATGYFGRFPACLVAAAEFERDRRQRAFPQLIADQKLEEEPATVELQSWIAIAAWLRSGRATLLGGWAGNAEPPRQVLSWQLLEQMAAKALSGIDRALARGDSDELRIRRENLFVIHAILVSQRESIARLDELTAAARALMATPERRAA